MSIFQVFIRKGSMKIVLATCGSRGDVQPMVALTLALKSAGHDVLLLGPPEKARWAEQLGCPYQKFGRDVTAFINRMETAVNLQAGIRFVSFVRRELTVQFKLLPWIIKGADRVIASSLIFGLSSIAQAMDIPYQYIGFTAQLFPSRDHPFLTVKTQSLPPWINGLTWKGAGLADRFNITFLINSYRKKMGLPSIGNAWDHILGDRPIAACDRQVAMVPKDVRKAVVQTGYLHLDLPRVSRPGLEQFLEKGDRPIYAGFGSMPSRDRNKTIPLIIEAARSIGKRIIVGNSHGKASGCGSSNDLFFIHSFPHLELFPQTCTVIHHGGAGTTATAAVSGVPQVIVPHILDQYFHGHRIYLDRLGPRPIHRSRLTKGRLVAALMECLSNPKIKKTAEHVGKSIDRYKSMDLAVKAVEHAV
jgi:UDP:flavonoid glycosyltransferase YjiC (YdhE family)